MRKRVKSALLNEARKKGQSKAIKSAPVILSSGEEEVEERKITKVVQGGDSMYTDYEKGDHCEACRKAGEKVFFFSLCVDGCDGEVLSGHCDGQQNWTATELPWLHQMHEQVLGYVPYNTQLKHCWQKVQFKASVLGKQAYGQVQFFGLLFQLQK